MLYHTQAPTICTAPSRKNWASSSPSAPSPWTTTFYRAPSLSSLARLSALTTLDAQMNLLTGTVPTVWFDGVGALEVLDLDSNFLRGGLEGIGRLGELRRLNVFDNGFGGTMPADIGDLTALEYAYLDFNNFTGNVAPAICSLKDDTGGSLVELAVDCHVGCACCSPCFGLALEHRKKRPRHATGSFLRYR